MERVDAVVVGLGTMGSAAARSLGMRGVETIALEQFEVGHDRGSSHGHSRIFRISYPDPVYVDMCRRSHALWRELEDRCGERLLETTGGIDAGEGATDCGNALEVRGEPHEWISRAEAAERFPMVSFEGLDSVLFHTDGGVLLADRCVRAQVELAGKAGVDVREGVRISRITPGDGDVTVETDGRAIRARVAVVTAGGWAGPLLAAAGIELPLTPTVQEVSYFGGPDVEMPTFIEWIGPGLAWYTLGPAGHAPGMKVGDHRVGRPIDPDDGPFDADPAVVEGILEYARRRFPTVADRPLHSETCLYTMTPDHDFLLDRIGPIVVGSPCSGHGFKFAPLIGEALADLAQERDPDLPAGRFSVARF